MKCSSPYQFRRRSGMWIDAPCGKCPACRVNRASEWATRLMHEIEPENGQEKTGWFITLTYENAPETLNKEELQKFFKRVRKDGVEMKYFACGEYGEKNGRPHYHIAAITKQQDVQWNKYWTLGLIDIGTLTFESARYTANYLLKQAGEESTSQKPFQLMSKGLGGAWAHANDKVVRRGLTKGGKPIKTPRYYRKQLDIVAPRMDPHEKHNYWQRKLNNDGKINTTIRRDKV